MHELTPATARQTRERLVDLLQAGEPGAPRARHRRDGRHADLRAGSDSRSRRSRGRLATLGVGRGSRVAIVIPTVPTSSQLLLAVVRSARRPRRSTRPTSATSTRFYLDDLEPELLLVPRDELAAAREAVARRGPGRRRRATATASLRRWSRRRRRSTARRRSATPTRTTSRCSCTRAGRPAGPSRCRCSSATSMASARTIAALLRARPRRTSRTARCRSSTSTGSSPRRLAALAGGGTVVVPRRFAPRALLAAAASGHGVTWFSAGPTLHQMILDQRRRRAAPPARFASSARAARRSSPALMERAEEAYGAPMLEAYGMTEASHQMASNPLPPGRAASRARSASRRGVEIRIVDAQGDALAQGAPGEVAIRGPGVTAGYLDNPEANAESFFDGWFRTGDRGVVRRRRLPAARGPAQGDDPARRREHLARTRSRRCCSAHPAVADAVCFGDRRREVRRAGRRRGRACAARRTSGS